MQLQAQRIKDLEAQLEASISDKKVHEEAELKLQKAYDDLTDEFELREGRIEQLAAELGAEKQSRKTFYDDLTKLRREYHAMQKKFNETSVLQAETQALNLNLNKNNEKLSVDASKTRDQL